jgi:hypothetical protein
MPDSDDAFAKPPMPDSFHVMGNEIHYGPWYVMDIRTDIPASVREKVVEALEEMPTEEAIRAIEEAKYDEGWQRALSQEAMSARMQAAYQRGWGAAQKDSSVYKRAYEDGRCGRPFAP